MRSRAYDTGRVLFVLLAVAAILTSVYEVTFEEWDAYAFRDAGSTSHRERGSDGGGGEPAGGEE